MCYSKHFKSFIYLFIDDLLSDYELAPRASNNCFKRSFSPTEDDISKYFNS